MNEVKVVCDGFDFESQSMSVTSNTIEGKSLNDSGIKIEEDLSDDIMDIWKVC